MAIVDWVIIAILVVSAVSAAKSGLIVEVFSLAGLILGLLLASWDYQKLVPWMGRWIHSLPGVEAASFLTIAIGVMLAAALAGRFVRWSANSIGLGWLDRMAGAVFGLVKGCVLVTVVVIVVAAFWPGATWLRRSHLAPGFLAMAHQAAAAAPADLQNRIRQGVMVLRKDQPVWIKPAA